MRATSLHGILESDALRHGLLRTVAAARGRTFTPSALPYPRALDAHLDHLADWVEEHLDLSALLDLARSATRVQDAPGW